MWAALSTPGMEEVASSDRQAKPTFEGQRWSSRRGGSNQERRKQTEEEEANRGGGTQRRKQTEEEEDNINLTLYEQCRARVYKGLQGFTKDPPSNCEAGISEINFMCTKKKP